MPEYGLYNFDINSDVIVLYFAASFDNIHLIEHYEHPKSFPWKVCMLHKSSAQFLVVTDKRDTHGIWENVQVNFCYTVYAIYFAGVLFSRISRVGCYSRIYQHTKIFTSDPDAWMRLVYAIHCSPRSRI